MKMLYSQALCIASGPADCNIRSGCDTANIMYTSSDLSRQTTKMYEEQGPDDMKSEYPSCIEECFASSLEGAYFKRELQRARDDNRAGLPPPDDPSVPPK